MAQQTALQVYGLPGRVLSFIAKAPADVAVPVALTLWPRSEALTLETRSRALTLHDRSTALTLETR